MEPLQRSPAEAPLRQVKNPGIPHYCRQVPSNRHEQALKALLVAFQLEGHELAHLRVSLAVGGEQAVAARQVEAGQIDQRLGVGHEGLELEHHAVLVAWRGVERVVVGVDGLQGHGAGAGR